MSDHSAPEQRTIDVDVQDIDTRGRTLHGYAAVYNAVSGDLGGFRERIAPGAFANVLDADVRALLNHDPNEVLGRTKSGTLRLFDEQRGLRFEIDVPDSPLGENVRSAVKRGDLDGASFRFVVGDEAWDGDLRTVKTVKELRDVTLATYPAYPDSSVELRSRPEQTNNREDDMSEETKTEERSDEQRSENEVEEYRREPAGSLFVEDRAALPKFVNLTDQFRSRGFPGETASVSADEFRAATFGGGTVTYLNQQDVVGGALGYDQRWAWMVPPQVSVDAGVTSVSVFQQTSRTVLAGTAVLRDIDAVTNKPETASALNVATVSLQQVASVESGIPNVYLERQELATVVENDLRSSVFSGLDELVRAGLATSGFQAPSTDNILVSIRKAVTTLRASGYTPDTLLLTPAASETIDTMVTGIASGTADFVFGAGRFAPGTLFGLNVIESKVLAAPVVLDSKANGKLYLSPISLARFEENAGKTNSSLIRLECHAAYGVERTAAAIRIAAS